MRRAQDEASWRITNPNAKTVTIPASVTSLTFTSFPRGTRFEILTFAPGSLVSELGSRTFALCQSLKFILIPSSVVEIHAHCFPKSIETIAFQPRSKLKRIYARAFDNCPFLKSICLPASAELIDGSSFLNCGLSEILVENGNRHFAVRRSFLVDLQGIRIVRYFGQGSEVAVPDVIETIGLYSFEGCDVLVSVSFGTSSRLSRIEAHAFFDCSALTWICIPSSVTSLALACFGRCSSLRAIAFRSDSKLATLGDSTFESCCVLESIVIPPSVEVIGDNCFARCEKLRTVIFAPDSRVRKIGASAFYNCISLGCFCVPSSVEEVGWDCFQMCSNLSSFTFAFPSRLRALLHMPTELRPLFEIPDSVEHLRVPIGCKRWMLSFGRESKLKEIDLVHGRSETFDRGFLHFSTRSVKGLRSRFEFRSCSELPSAFGRRYIVDENLGPCIRRV
jgi:hypothetical protein